jgi:hypothetical protein
MQGLIKYINTKAKCCHLKKFTCKGILRQVFICLRPPPLVGFCLGWSSYFVGSEFGQIQSVKPLQNMVSKRTQHPQPPASHTLSVYIYCTLTQDGGGGGRRVEPEKVRGATVHKTGSKLLT